jgi:hypothetical protein
MAATKEFALNQSSPAFFSRNSPKWLRSLDLHRKKGRFRFEVHGPFLVCCGCAVIFPHRIFLVR